MNQSNTAELWHYVEKNLPEIRQMALATAFRYSFTVDEAQDLVHEVAVRILEISETQDLDFPSNSSFLAWTRSVLRNVSREHLRKRRHLWKETPLHEWHALAEDPQLIRVLDRNTILENVSRLPTNYRAVIELSLEGLTDQQIAKFLQITPQAVRQRKTRGNHKLRKLVNL